MVLLQQQLSTGFVDFRAEIPRELRADGYSPSIADGHLPCHLWSSQLTGTTLVLSVLGAPGWLVGLSFLILLTAHSLAPLVDLPP